MQTIALLTRHGKAEALAPALAVAGYQLITVDHFDTDTLGSFCGSTPREQTALETAYHKARLGATLGGCRYGLGSEGSYGPDPYLGASGWGVEYLAWWDDEAGYGVHVVEQGPAPHYRQVDATTRDEVDAFAAQIGFPATGLIAGRPGEAAFCKTLASLDDLQTHATRHLPSGGLWLATDMRAHRNPPRMAMIGHAGSKLAALLQQTCPQCRAPGFGEVRRSGRTPCSDCHFPTRIPCYHHWQCRRCGHETVHQVHELADPSQCDLCNP